MSKAKSNYYTSVISENSTDQRSLWKAFNKILHRHPVRLLPECPSLKQLAENFGCYTFPTRYLLFAPLSRLLLFQTLSTLLLSTLLLQPQLSISYHSSLLSQIVKLKELSCVRLSNRVT